MYVGAGIEEKKQLNTSQDCLSFYEVSVDNAQIEVASVSSIPSVGKKCVVVYSNFRNTFLTFVCSFDLVQESVVLFHLTGDDVCYSFLHSQLRHYFICGLISELDWIKCSR